MRGLASARGLSLTVGVHAAEGGAGHTGSKLSVAEIATIHEYGLGTSPQRSFIRAWADSRKAEHQRMLKIIGENVVKGRYDAATGLARLGNLFVGEVQARISGGIPPPNAPSTVARKGSSKPLINTGQLRSSIRFRVNRGGADITDTITGGGRGGSKRSRAHRAKRAPRVVK